MDAKEINDLLLRKFEEVCQLLLPNGKRKGSHWLVGGLDGTAGESLQITLEGSAAGRFIDFANKDTKGASPLWLWKQVKGCSFTDAISQAKEYLGVQDTDFGIRRHSPKSYEKCGVGDAKPVTTETRVMDYLVIERRLDPIVVAKSKICEAGDDTKICFLYLEKNPETGNDACVHRKYLDLDRPNGKKVVISTKGTKRCLYGKNLIPDDANELVITEGEIDALSYNSWGVPAVSMPNGTSDMEWIDIDWDWLSRFEKIYVSTDMDEPGRACSKDLCQRIGLHRSYIVELPHKDANECLTSGMKLEDIQLCLKHAKAIELDEIKRPDDFKGEVMDYYQTDPAMRGVETPWSPTLPWRVRKGELTIMTGFSGHGKALSINTPIPTPYGWKTMGELFPGDQVFDQDGKPCNVVFATPVQLNRKCYEVEFSDGSKIVADAEHLWETWSPHARNSAARKKLRSATLRPKGTRQDHKRAMSVIINTETISKSLKETKWNDGSHSRHAIPVAGALKLGASVLEVDAYCFGAWLGDGDSSGYGFTCGNGDEQIIQQFRDQGFAMKPLSVGKDKAPRYSLLGFRKLIKDSGVLDNKHIPAHFLRSSEEQRLDLLKGLMDTDGCITPYGRCEFTSMSKKLAENVFELVCSLGIRPTLTTGIASVNGKDCGTKYRVFFTPSKQVFRLDRKASRINLRCSSRRDYRYILSAKEIPSVPVKCIQVDSPRHLYLCGKTMIPTHNTAGLNQLMLHMVSKGMKVMDASLEIRPGMTLYNMTRCALGKKFSTKDEIHGCIEWLNESVFFLDCIGTVNVTRIMHAMEYARKRHGIDVFIIDSLFKCGLSSEDYGGARDFADKLTTFCNNTGAHVILVAHSRKVSSGNEYAVPTKSDVAGSSDLTNAAFNVIIFWRNKLKKKRMDEAQQNKNTEEVLRLMDEPDGKIVIDKQRFGEGEEREVYIWFDAQSCQFHTTKATKRPYFVMEKPKILQKVAQNA